MKVVEKSIILIGGYFNKDELIKSGSIVFISSLIAGLFNYIYQVYMGRALGPEDYGTFGALFAIFYIIGIISQTLSTSITRFISKFIGEGKQIGFFIKGSLRYLIIFGLIISIIFFIFRRYLMNIFKIADPMPMYIIILILFLTCIEPIMGGTLRGVKRFNVLSITNISNTFCKLIFGISLVILGFGVVGALAGIVFGILAGMIISFIFIRGYIKPNNPHEPDFKISSFYFYSLPVMLAMISYSVPSNFDVILAKYYFSPLDAGIYNSVAVLGKIIFFFPGAIGTVMFPMVAEKYVRKENTKNILKKSVLYTGILSGSLALVYVLFPGLVIKVFGDRYDNAIGLVGSYGMAMFFFSIIGIIMSYHLAIKNVRYIALFTGFTIVEIILLSIFHSSALEMIEILLLTNFLLLSVSIIYTFKDFDKNKMCGGTNV